MHVVEMQELPRREVVTGLVILTNEVPPLVERRIVPLLPPATKYRLRGESMVNIDVVGVGEVTDVQVAP